MNIDIRAKAMCTDGLAGFCTRVIVNPTALQVSHLVVQENEAPHPGFLEPLDQLINTGRLVPPERPVHIERLVPLEQVTCADADGIQLACTRQELSHMDELVEYTFKQVTIPNYPDYIYVTLTGDEIANDILAMPVTKEHIPSGEVAIDSRTRVEATDGKVGQVDGLEIESQSGGLISLVIREGPPWDQKCVAIPAAEIDLVESQVVYLKLGKRDVGAMPVVPVGMKKGEQDMDAILDQLERESEAFERNLLKLEEQFAQGNAENRASVQRDINTLRQQRDAARAQVKANLEQAKREADARFETLHNQMKDADEQQKANIERRMAEVRVEQKTLAEKLEKAEASIKDTMRFDFSEGGEHDSAQ